MLKPPITACEDNILTRIQGFWYGTFTAGNAQNLSLLIDTGSSDAAVNPNLYKPSSASKNLHKSGALRYSTTQENGCGSADIKYNEYSDTFSQAGLTSKAQTFGNVYPTTPPDNGTITVFPHDGLVGYAGIASSELGATPFFTNLCNQNVVPECRFGLAFKTDGTGQQILGELDSSLYAGSSLTTAKISGQWELQGDVALAGKVLARNQRIITDSGTANIIGPPGQVQALFDAAGIESVNISLPGCTEVLTGYYPCDKPPTVGFVFPSGSKNVFNIEPSAFDEAQNGGGNCTAIVSGIDFGANTWLIGQAWFQGKYVDHNVQTNTMGIAQLKEK